MNTPCPRTLAAASLVLAALFAQATPAAPPPEPHGLGEPSHPGTLAPAPAQPATSVAPRLIDLTRTPARLSVEDRLRTITGRSLFSDPWVEAGATTTLRDGLGPMFSARSCTACHPGGGRGKPPPLSSTPTLADPSLIVRLGQDAQRGTPNYGPQLQPRSTLGERQTVKGRAGQAQGEGLLRVSYAPRHARHADGTPYTLYAPKYQLAQLRYGRLAPSTPMSVRLAPSLDTLARIHAVSDSALLALEDPHDRDGDGISGRAHRVPLAPPRMHRGQWVWPERGIGRYGYKAGQPTLVQQTASALHEDMGITSAWYPMQACAPEQTACREAPTGAGPRSAYEIDDPVLAELVFFLQHLRTLAPTSAPTLSPTLDARAASPSNAANASPLRGADLFRRARCVACHTDAPTHAGLYSDLLLHDMGPGLADGRPEHQASGREWRTAPLAGLGQRARLSPVVSYLHDGRARTLEEAILWHGGEARAARDEFSRWPAADRAALLAFLATR